MQNEGNAILIVEKGSEAGKTIYLEHDTIILGRGQTGEGRVSFDNPFVSRIHAQIHYDNGCFQLRDLGSTNGTQLNGKPLEKLKDYPLSDNDTIELAKASVVLRFCRSESTIEIRPGDEPPPAHPPSPSPPPIRVDADARDIWVDGIRLDPPLTRMEFELLLMLYRNMGKACSKNDLAKLWGGNIPADEQIEQTIHRIRLKIERDPSKPSRIVTVRGYGYKLVSTD